LPSRQFLVEWIQQEGEPQEGEPEHNPAEAGTPDHQALLCHLEWTDKLDWTFGVDPEYQWHACRGAHEVKATAGRTPAGSGRPWGGSVVITGLATPTEL